MTQRLLIYSHDTFGLGHLKRCRSIAAAITAARPDVRVLIATGSPLAERFPALERVDLVRLPAVQKNSAGGYAPLQSGLSLPEVLELRSQLLAEMGADFKPDVLLVDKEPLGLGGELEPLLEELTAQGSRLILGLRDILDAPEALAREWQKSGVMEAMARYHSIWVYGDAALYKPLSGLPVSPQLNERLQYLGYLAQPPAEGAADMDTVLVTTGGGGDGAALLTGMLHVAALRQQLKFHLITGPFVGGSAFEALAAQAAPLKNVILEQFQPDLAASFARAGVVVAMAGYNTFCDVLAGRKRAVFAPRTSPRQEQLLRAEQAAAMGLGVLAMPEDVADPVKLAARLEQARAMPLPPQGVYSALTGGLNRLVTAFNELSRG
ncbi:MAG: hypothetical protein LW855_01350 [Alphaproteobacteria bacterium]|jgi:predicted glycosyltransferase|nr:hypothetical protein [Thalassospira sp.]MCE2964423.1 hypothetical protein [Alphaproteobacteria bacterium]